MNVSFLNSIYRPSDEERYRLERVQEEIHFEKLNYLRTLKLKGYTPKMLAEAKEKFHISMRGQWTVIEGQGVSLKKEA
jgi:hypothetical protein